MERGHNISGIQLVVIFDKAETVHQLDLRDLAGAMAAEMFFDVAFSHVAGKVPKIEAGRRHLSHGWSEITDGR